MAEPRNASGRFVVRVPSDLHRQLKRVADEAGSSLNALCVRLLKDGSRESLGTGDVGCIEYLPLASSRQAVASLSAFLGDRLVGVVLFGSVARGDSVPSSDIDLLAVVSPVVEITRDLYDGWDSRAPEALIVDRISVQFVLLPSKPEVAGSLWLETAMDGVVLYDPSLEVSRFLADLRRWVASGGAIRKIVHGHPYWVRT